MKTALLLVDIQNDYFPNGTMIVDGSFEASLKAKEALEFFRARNLPVIHIQHICNHPGATFFLPGTEGAEIHKHVKPKAGETVFQKHFPNSFRETPLLDHLREQEIDHLVICGMKTHMCIDATTRAAFDYGIQCTVLHDACATEGYAFQELQISPEQVHGSFVAALGSVYATVQSVGEYCASAPE